MHMQHETMREPISRAVFDLQISKSFVQIAAVFWEHGEFYLCVVTNKR